ncbi:hypothetical protein Thiowin_03614 [Thiorhodovibrio winogradskyi]|uniref:Ribosomal subunit interface protein n=1 Tax=Thiorhodovibrio winogradskyi TaxID=77007 RepID=A0ABZ0SEK8_9GAMM|nr:hypothetical protein [Thiorhodovibrio winogradskyi]
MHVEIQGDMLALDGQLCRHIRSQAEAFLARFPSYRIELIAHIGEEFDALKGHRVRCELRTSVADRQQIIVRQARKSADDAIAAAFVEIKKKFRQMSRRLNNYSNGAKCDPACITSIPAPKSPVSGRAIPSGLLMTKGKSQMSTSSRRHPAQLPPRLLEQSDNRQQSG